MNAEKGIAELLEAVIAGDKTSENELFSKLYERFYNLVRHKIWSPKADPVQMRQNVDDVVQMIMLAISEHLRKGTIPVERFMPWAFTIARFKIADYFRKPQPILVDDDVVTPERPDRNFESKEAIEIIYNALGKLPQRCKEIMQALLREGRKSFVHEESKKMSRKTIDVQIHRCRKRFAILLKQEGYVL